MSNSAKLRKSSEETKKKISNALKGKIYSDETRKKMSDFQKNRVRKPWTEEQKLNMSRIKKIKSKKN